jgi:CubicO group peptidase (beta-lactamase class C family)
MRTAISLIFFFVVSQSLPAQKDLLHKEIVKILKFESPVDFNIVPGILVGVIDGDSTYVCSYGEVMSKDSVYELGSVTKPIVAWLVGKALDSLGWSVQDPVCRFMPDSLCSGNWKLLTIDQVIKHQSGLDRFLLPRPYNNYSSHTDTDIFSNKKQLAVDIKTMIPSPDKYWYSHVAYALFIWLFDHVGGIDQFSQHTLTEQLTMNHTGFCIADEEIAQGHGKDGRKQSPWHANAFAPAIGLKASLEDVITFIKYISPDLAERTPEFSSVLKKELANLSKKPEYKVIDGWFLIQSGLSLVFYHTGRTSGHQVSIAFIPGSRKGVVVFSNGAAGSNDLCLHVLDMIAK